MTEKEFDWDKIEDENYKKVRKERKKAKDGKKQPKGERINDDSKLQ